MTISTVRKFGVGIASAAMVLGLAGPAMAKTQEVPGPLDGSVQTGRVGGYDRIETAIAIAKKAFIKRNNEVEVAYLASASSASAVDSAAAGHLSDGPIYLVSSNPRDWGAVSAAINGNFPNVQKVIAIGGTKAVSDKALKTIGDAISGSTDRLGGADRYETATKIAAYGIDHKGLSSVGQFSSSKVYLARGDNPVDALVSGVMDDAPVLLLGPDGSVPAATADYLKKNLPSSFVALGGKSAVPDSAFMKADFNPVMRNVWVNNEDVKNAQDAVEEAEFLLNGVPGASGINPRIKAATAGLSDVEVAALRAQLASLQGALGTEESKVTGAIGNKAKAEKDALDAAKGLYEGKGSKDNAGRDDANYKGSMKAAEEAKTAVDNGKAAVKKIEDNRKEVKDAVDAAIKTYGSSAKDEAAAHALGDAVKSYLVKFNDGSEVTLDNTLTKANADKFVALWEAQGIDGVTDKNGTAPTTAGKGTSYNPVGGYDDKISATKLDEAKKTLKSAEDALIQAKALADSDKQAMDKAQQAYDEKLAKLASDDPEVKKAKDAVAAIESAIAKVNAQIEASSGQPAFMGYDRIEKQYSSIDGYYSNLLAEKKASIDRVVSQALNNKMSSPADLAANGHLVLAVKQAYGIDLTGSNVEKYFAFKTVNGVKKVSRANHVKMAAENDALAAKAKELINDFYAKMVQGFNTGDMVAWFRLGMYRTYYTGYGDLTEDQRKLVMGAADAVISALTTVENPVNPGAADGAARVAHYLESVALNNKKVTEEKYNKAKRTLQEVLDRVFPKRYDRLEGKDRYETSAAIAGYWRAAYVGNGGLGEQMQKPIDIYVANGDTFIDAVAGGQLVEGPIVLANAKGELEDTVKQRFAFAKTDTSLLNIVALGGTAAVPDSTLATAKSNAFDKSWLSKVLFTDATGRAVDNGKAADNAKDKKPAEKK